MDYKTNGSPMHQRTCKSPQLATSMFLLSRLSPKYFTMKPGYKISILFPMVTKTLKRLTV